MTDEQRERERRAIRRRDQGLIDVGVPARIVRDHIFFTDTFPELDHLRVMARSCFANDVPYAVVFVGGRRAETAHGAFGRLLINNHLTVRFMGWSEFVRAAVDGSIYDRMSDRRVCSLDGLPWDDAVTQHRDVIAETIGELYKSGVWFVLHAREPLSDLPLGRAITAAFADIVQHTVVVEGK